MLLLLSARLWQRDWCAAEKALYTQLNGRIRPLSLDSSHWNHTIPFIRVYNLSTQVFVWLDGFYALFYLFFSIICLLIYFLLVLYLFKWSLYTVALRQKIFFPLLLLALCIQNDKCRLSTVMENLEKSGIFLILLESNKTSKFVEMFLCFESQKVKCSI